MLSITVYKVVCPECGGHFFETDQSAGFDDCLHCKADIRHLVEDGLIIEHMYHVSIDPITGKLSYSDTIII